MMHAGRCAHPHGHNGLVRIVLRSDMLNEQGMVLDFGELKRTIGVWIEENLDHRMVLRHDDPLVAVLREMHEPVFVMEADPTAENLARLIYEKSMEFGFPVEKVVFRETERCSAEYRHGLKNCD